MKCDVYHCLDTGGGDGVKLPTKDPFSALVALVGHHEGHQACKVLPQLSQRLRLCRPLYSLSLTSSERHLFLTAVFK